MVAPFFKVLHAQFIPQPREYPVMPLKSHVHV